MNDPNQDSIYSKKGYDKNLEMSHLIDGKIGINEERGDSMDFSQPLVPSEKRASSNSFFSKIKYCLGFRPPEGDRLIYLNGTSAPKKYAENLVKNQKYSVLSFIPLVLYNQFRFFFNLFYLLIALTQFVPPLKVGFLFTYVGPLCLVLVLTMLKEGFDDFKRYKRDKEANSSLYKVIKPDGLTKLVPSMKLKVGDIIELHPKQRIPADLILLYSSEENGTTFIKTDQLDGETDWKLRRSIRFTQQFFSQPNFDVSQLNGSIVYQPPSENIYNFEGVFYANAYSSDVKLNEPLFLDHTLWANTSITSGKIYGAILYTGKDTRIVMNSREPRSKTGKLDEELNLITKLLFLCMILLAGVIVFLNGFMGKWYLQYFRYILLMASIIPISLRVNLDFAKAIFSYKINRDDTIPGTIARNSSIPEELGRISFLLTDKTGTLTQNDMHFKKLVLEHVQYEEENVPLIAKLVKVQCEKSNGPLQDVEERMRDGKEPVASLGGLQSKPKKVRREKENVLRDLITAFAVCHNVTPIIEDGKRSFHASSPDEIALVNFAQEVKMKLVARTNDQIDVENPAGQREVYQVLANFPFSSETKRMGILVRHQATGRLIFFLKGADVAIQSKVKEVYKGLLLDECEALARTGLRTMVFAQKYITEAEYQNWKRVWDEAHSSLTKRDEKMRKAADLLETDMEFIGISGVEDRLQDDINVTLESLRNAGIKIWMLTGDKIETAKCIAISTGLKGVNQDMFEIRDTEDDLQLVNKINEFSNRVNTVLILDGHSLSRILETNQKVFFEAAVRAPAVVCSRCLPTQKAMITELVKKYSGKRVACIGDGGNDVGMIQSADLGIGIVGKEGKQASLASDFSVYEFQYIKTLILWHGRLYYKNAAKLSQFVIHRGLIISFMQALFMCVFYFVAIPIYNGYLMLGYTTIYTMFPVFSLIFDQDINREKALNYPLLYKSLQLSRELNFKTLCVWLWKSLFQASVIVLMALYIFPDTFVQIVTITFTALIISEILNVYTELHKLHPVMILSFIGTVLVYFASITMLKEYINVQAITKEFLIKISIIVSISWLPLHIFKCLVRELDPSDYQKVMRTI